MRTQQGNVAIAVIAIIVLAALAGGAYLWFNLGPATITPVAVPGPTTGPEGTGPAPGPDPELLEKYGSGPAPEQGSVYEGAVTDALARPIAGATIRSGPRPHPDEVVATTDARGLFEISLPEGEPPTVRMEAPGYYPQVIELEPTPEIPYLLFHGGVVRGVVRGPYRGDSGGSEVRPVAGVRLEVAGTEGWSHELSTDAQGRYSFTAPPGALVLTVRSNEFRDRQVLDLEAVRDEEVVHDLTLEAGVELQVVLLADGEAVADAHLRVLTDLGVEGEGRSDGVGKATFRGLTPGSGRVVVVRSGYRAELHGLVLGEDRPLIRRPITLTRSTPWTLEVFDAEGNPRPDAEVRIRLDRIDLLETTAGDAASLQILGPDRDYSIEVRAPDAPRTRLRWRIPTDGPPRLRVVLPEGGRVSGVVVDRRDAPIAGAGVLISPVGGRDLRQGPPRLTSTAADGSFTTELLAPGPYRVQVHHPRLGRVGVDARIFDGRDVELGTIHLVPDEN